MCGKIPLKSRPSLINTEIDRLSYGANTQQGSEVECI